MEKYDTVLVTRELQINPVNLHHLAGMKKDEMSISTPVMENSGEVRIIKNRTVI